MVSLESVFSKTLSIPINQPYWSRSLWLTDSQTWSGVSLSSRTPQYSFHFVIVDRDDEYDVKLDEVFVGLSRQIPSLEMNEVFRMKKLNLHNERISIFEALQWRTTLIRTCFDYLPGPSQ